MTDELIIAALGAAGHSRKQRADVTVRTEPEQDQVETRRRSQGAAQIIRVPPRFCLEIGRLAAHPVHGARGDVPEQAFLRQPVVRESMIRCDRALVGEENVRLRPGELRAEEPGEERRRARAACESHRRPAPRRGRAGDSLYEQLRRRGGDIGNDGDFGHVRPAGSSFAAAMAACA